ncbi:MAG: GTP 3',8-cyclase MoaA [Candidatus Omnitrophica bacterium]|nr:GTP 3',8-cyclase [bacterium]NUN97236.1 GTP 3',8-cyclase MoaA [Candidatus Omnitrophota bacterium]
MPTAITITRMTMPIREPLVDRFGRVHTYLRVSVTDRCNLRCVYCMPSEGFEHVERDEILTYEEILRVVRLMAEIGIHKVRVTGGEPLVRKGLANLIAGIVATPGIETVAMTTNAVLLAEQAESLKRAGLSHLNISLDTLRADRFEAISRRANLREALAGIEAAIRSGFDPIKLNMVVMGGVNDDELLDFVELARHRPIQVRFLEFMPFKSNGWDQGTLVSYAEMRRRIEEQYDLIPLFIPDGPADVTKEFAIPGFEGTIGFITSMTEDFCKDCNRIRLLADGSLKSCLFHPPEENLRAALRRGTSDDEVEGLIRRCVSAKLEKHEELEELIRLENNPMIAIGG